MLRSVKYGLYGLLVAGIVGGTVAWTNVDKTVHLVVDGRAQTIHTTVADVGQVLQKAGYRPGAHDLLAPSASSHVKDGTTIVFKRGRLLRLDIDGVDRFVWTTAPTVAQALSELGYTTNDFTSVSRSRRLPLGPTDIALRTPKLVTVVHDGHSTSVTSTDATVGQLLTDLSLVMGPDDRLSAPMSAPLTAGANIKVTRVERKTLTKTRAVAFDTRSTKDSSLAIGTTKVLARGRKGVLDTTWAAVYVDGKLAGETKVASLLARAPVDRVQKIGTKQPKVAASSTKSANTARTSTPRANSAATSGSARSTGSSSPTGSPRTIAKSLLKSYGWGQDQFSCLNSIWSRESGWRVNAANPSGAYGIPQALPGSKMASAGPNWQTNAATQIKWGLNYIAARYNSPCQAWSIWQSQGWY